MILSLATQQLCSRGTLCCLGRTERTLGGMFYELCDELKELDWAIALQQLVEILEEALEKSSKIFKKFIKCQLQQWFASLPNYIKVYLPILSCES